GHECLIERHERRGWVSFRRRRGQADTTGRGLSICGVGLAAPSTEADPAATLVSLYQTLVAR
ncbi:MAG: hypothetical protein AAGN64_17025, partial [Bacteroidota bacterium]